LRAGCLETARQKYRSPDGNAGWAISIHPDGTISDPARDLCSYAFVLYMMDWRVGHIMVCGGLGRASFPMLTE
jgi:hypothetical protein